MVINIYIEFLLKDNHNKDKVQKATYQIKTQRGNLLMKLLFYLSI